MWKARGGCDSGPDINATTVGAFIPLLLLPGMAGNLSAVFPDYYHIAVGFIHCRDLCFTRHGIYLFKPSKYAQRKHRIRAFSGHFKVGTEKEEADDCRTAACNSPLRVDDKPVIPAIFPKADTNMIIIDIEHEHANDISQTEILATQETDILKLQEEVTGYTVSVYNGLTKLY